jgi:hypothetical protein
MVISNGWILLDKRLIGLSKMVDVKLANSTIYFYDSTENKETNTFILFSTESEALAAFIEICQNLVPNV